MENVWGTLSKKIIKTKWQFALKCCRTSLLTLTFLKSQYLWISWCFGDLVDVWMFPSRGTAGVDYQHAPLTTNTILTVFMFKITFCCIIWSFLIENPLLVLSFIQMALALIFCINAMTFRHLRQVLLKCPNALWAAIHSDFTLTLC